MAKSRVWVFIVAAVALTLFFISAIWPFLTASNIKTSKVKTATPVEVVVVEPIVPEVLEPVVPDIVVVDIEPPPPEGVEPIEVEPQPPVVELDNNEPPTTDALYSVIDGNKLDENSYAGFKLYRNWCARCHGPYGQGLVGPNLADSLNVIIKEQFFDTVENGKAGSIGSMPAWKTNVKVMEGQGKLYAYLMARADGAIGVVKPKKQ